MQFFACHKISKIICGRVDRCRFGTGTHIKHIHLFSFTNDMNNDTTFQTGTGNLIYREEQCRLYLDNRGI